MPAANTEPTAPTGPAVPSWWQLGDLPGLAGSHRPRQATEPESAGHPPANYLMIGLFTALAYLLAWLAGITATTGGRLLVFAVILVAAVGLFGAFDPGGRAELSQTPVARTGPPQPTAGAATGPDDAPDRAELVDHHCSRGTPGS